MRTCLSILTALLLPITVLGQFTVGQTSGANVTYFDFPDITVCSFGLESIDLDLDGDQIDDFKLTWALGTPHQDCWDRSLSVKRSDLSKWSINPLGNTLGDSINAGQFPFVTRFWEWIDYCPDYIDSNIIYFTHQDFFGPGADSYLPLQLDSAGTDFAWIRASSDTTGSNYCLTLKDAARYRAPLSATAPLLDELDLEVYPTVVRDELWLRAGFGRPTELSLRFVALDGRLLAESRLVTSPGSIPLAIPVPALATGMVFLQVSSGTASKTFKLLLE